MNKNNIFNTLVWQGNSKKMYEAIIKSVPPIFVSNVRNSIANWIRKNDLHIITEELVFKAVDDIATASIANKIRPRLNEMRSNSSDNSL